MSIFSFAYLALLMLINAVIGKDMFQLMYNHIHPNMSFQAVGSWSNWITGYHVNDKHDGYLDIGTVSFNAENLNLTYMADTNCTNDYPLFANGRIYCVSTNMLFSYYPQNGSMAFWYLSIGPASLKNPTFATSGDYTSIFLYTYSSFTLYISSFDAMTGELKRTSTLPTYTSGYFSPYAVGTPYGQVYLTSRNASTTSNASVYAYNIQTYGFTQSNYNVRGPSEVPSMCDNKVIVSGYYAFTDAYNPAPDFEEQWVFEGEGPSTSSSSALPPVCLKNANGYRVVVKPYSSSNYNCYVLNTLNGELVYQFQCGTTPIFHYDKDTGFADIAIIGTGVLNQVLAVEMDGDNIIHKELWYDEGNIDHGFIVSDYFVTAIKRDSYTVEVKILDIFTGNIIWDYVSETQPYGFTYAVFGGLYDNGEKDEFMLIVRIGNTFYAYTELIDDV